MSQKIGILGGTFNPVHYGHLFIAEQAYRQFHLDEIWFLPSGNPPHKPSGQIAEDADREAMLLLSIQDVPYFRYSDIEFNRSGTIYTVDTMKLLKESYPDSSFYFIAGADSLFSIDTWKNPLQLFQYCSLIVAGRPKFETDGMKNLQNKILEVKECYHAEIALLHAPLLDISSSGIRCMLKNGQSPKFLLPDSVLEYILQKKLYSNR